MHLPHSALDAILTLQLLIAWAGEGETESPRLGWWRTAMVEADGGQALLRRLAPRTWRWAALQAAREAARRTDEAARERASNPDRLYSLYRFGFAVDEQLQERLIELKLAHEDPATALPSLGPLLAAFDRDALADHLAALATAEHSATPNGRLLRGPMPAPELAARNLAAGLLPLADRYPAPHYLDA